MSAFIGIIEPDAAARREALPALARSLQSQGFSDPQTLEWPEGIAVWCDSTHQPRPASRLLLRADGFVALVGVLRYRGLYHARALEALLDDFVSPDRLDPFDFAGNFQLLVCKQGRAWVFNDPIGMVKLYHLPARQLFSTSWLACAESSPRCTLDALAAREYVLTSANYGLRTPLAEVRLWDPRKAMPLASGAPAMAPVTWPASIWQQGRPFASLDDAVSACADTLSQRFDEVRSEFPGDVVTALSGGFDSRLQLAGLLRAQAKPWLYVFGPPDSEDVVAAKRISGALGLPIEHIDKAARDAGLPALSREALDASCRFFDGIPADGILERGSDRDTRTRYGSLGSVLLNGGAGEILRNYILLHDRPFSAPEIVQTFYCGFDPQAFPEPSHFAEYKAALAEDMETQLEQHGRMHRKYTELAYPLFRSRFWLSRNNSVANRVGWYWTMLLEPELVRQSFQYPMAWKDYGVLEARVIAALHPQVAAFQSAYGFDFLKGPSRSFRSNMWFQYRRPPALRARTAQLKLKLGMLRHEPAPAEWRALFPAELKMASVLRLDRLTGTDQWNRVLTLEYLMDRLSVSR